MLKVTPKMATPGAESAVYDFLVVHLLCAKHRHRELMFCCYFKNIL